MEGYKHDINLFFYRNRSLNIISLFKILFSRFKPYISVYLIDITAPPLKNNQKPIYKKSVLYRNNPT